MRSLEPFRIYWKLYGGYRALLKSAYFWGALLLTGVCTPLWLKVDMLEETRPAIQIALTIIPGLMAFSLGGVAVVLALSGKHFLKAIRESGAENSLFMKVGVYLFHFLFVQSLALVACLVSSSYPTSAPLGGLAFFLTAYGITAALATAAILFNVARIFNATGALDDDEAAQ
ncbi:MAG: hypothetical protein QOH04_2427 [Sphingomonadales bacterium]|nr:hypothetical protein [Sphingomonadales bacterium]